MSDIDFTAALALIVVLLAFGPMIARRLRADYERRCRMTEKEREEDQDASWW